MRTLSRVLIPVMLVIGLAPIAVADGTAKGTMTVNGKKTPLSYAVAVTAKDPFDAKKMVIKLMLSNIPITPEALGDEFALIDLAGKGTLTGVKVEIDSDNQVISGVLYDPGFKKFNGSVSVTGMHKFEQTTKNATTIAGKLSIPNPDDFAGYTYEYSATFSTPISGGAGAGNAKTKQPASRDGKAAGTPLPTDGGAPGKAYRDYLKAMIAGDMPKIRAAVQSDRAKQMDDPDFKKMFPMIQAMAPKHLKITGGTIDGTQATLHATDQDGNETSEGTIEMVQEGGVWKVAQESWKSEMH